MDMLAKNEKKNIGANIYASEATEQMLTYVNSFLMKIQI